MTLDELRTAAITANARTSAMMTFSQKIYWARKKLDWSQIEMAKYLEVSRKSIQLWEEGKDPHTLVQDGVYTRLKLVLKGFDEPR